MLPVLGALALNALALALMRLPVWTPAARHLAGRIAVTLSAPRQRPKPIPKPAARPSHPVRSSQAPPATAAPKHPPITGAIPSTRAAHSTAPDAKQRKEQFREQLRRSAEAAVNAEMDAKRQIRSLDSIPAVPKAYRHVKRPPPQFLPAAGNDGYRMSVFHGKCYAQAERPLMFANYPPGMRHMMEQPHQVRCPWDEGKQPFHFKKHAFGTLNGSGPP